MEEEVWYPETLGGTAQPRGERLPAPQGCAGRSWVIAENVCLQLPLSSEHSLSAERIALVVAPVELCCPSFSCLRLGLSWLWLCRAQGAQSPLFWLFLVQIQQLCPSHIANCGWG